MPNFGRNCPYDCPYNWTLYDFRLYRTTTTSLTGCRRRCQSDFRAGIESEFHTGFGFDVSAQDVRVVRVPHRRQHSTTPQRKWLACIPCIPCERAPLRLGWHVDLLPRRLAGELVELLPVQGSLALGKLGARVKAGRSHALSFVGCLCPLFRVGTDNPSGPAEGLRHDNVTEHPRMSAGIDVVGG